MYDSRSSHPRNRGSRWDRDRGYGRNPFTATLPERQDIDEQVLAHLDGDMPARTRIDIDRLHGEALEFNRMAAWERELLIGSEFSEDIEVSWSSEEQDYWDSMLEEPEWEDDWPETFEPNMYTHDDCWMPYASVETCRDYFNGTDFIILHTNVRRRTA